MRSLFLDTLNACWSSDEYPISKRHVSCSAISDRRWIRSFALCLAYSSVMGIAISSVSCLAAEPDEAPRTRDSSVEFPLTASLTVYSRRANLPDVPESAFFYTVVDGDNYQVVAETDLSSGVPSEIFTRTKVGDYFTVTARTEGAGVRQLRELIEVAPPDGVAKLMNLESVMEGYGQFVGDGIPIVSHDTVLELIEAELVITKGMTSISGIPVQEYETVQSGNDPFFGAIRFSVWLNPTSRLRLGGKMFDDGVTDHELRLREIITGTAVTVEDLDHPAEDDLIADVRIAPLEVVLQEHGDIRISEVLTSTASVVSSTWLVGSSIVVTGTSEVPEGQSYLRMALESATLLPERSSWLVVNEITDGEDTILVFQGDNTSELPIVPIDDYWEPSWLALWEGHTGYLTDTRQVTLTTAVTGTQYSQEIPSGVNLPLPLPPFINLITWVEGEIRVAAVSATALDDVVLEIVRAWRAEAGE